MKTLPPQLLGIVVVLAISAWAQALPPEAPADPDEVVRAFLRCIPDQNVERMRPMLADVNNYHVVQEDKNGQPGIYSLTWSEWLKWLASTNQSVHTVDRLSMAKVSEDLATVIVVAHTEGDPRIDLRAVIVLTRKQDGQWRIVSWLQENSYRR